MMRLPARLTAKLAKVRIAQIFSSARESSLLYCVDPGVILHPGADAPVSREKMRELINNRAPVVWVGGSEPLHHSGVGHFVRAVARGGRFVFLETDGTLLPRRIHEFQPLPQLFLTVRLRSFEDPGSAFAVEGLRAARRCARNAASFEHQSGDRGPVARIRHWRFARSGSSRSRDAGSQARLPCCRRLSFVG